MVPYPTLREYFGVTTSQGWWCVVGLSVAITLVIYLYSVYMAPVIRKLMVNNKKGKGSKAE
jgi:hypothetical protein